MKDDMNIQDSSSQAYSKVFDYSNVQNESYFFEENGFRAPRIPPLSPVESGAFWRAALALWGTFFHPDSDEITDGERENIWIFLYTSVNEILDVLALWITESIQT
jgi:hypothetical protein